MRPHSLVRTEFEAYPSMARAANQADGTVHIRSRRRPFPAGRNSRGRQQHADLPARTVDSSWPRGSRRGRRRRKDRKSTRLNSSHTVISYAVFCLKKKKKAKDKSPTKLLSTFIPRTKSLQHASQTPSP